MANTKFIVKCPSTKQEFTYYGFNCPRENEYVRNGGLDFRVINVIHVPQIPYTGNGWTEVVIEVAEGRRVID